MAGTQKTRVRIISCGADVVAHPCPGIGKPDFKPGYNFYSPQEDVQLGKEYSAQVDKQLPLLNDAEALKYLNSLGKRLVAFAPNNHPEYAWQFRIVNSAEINAFALPGGYIYVNRGVFDAAENEAQLAGVIAHESGHVVMRHGTHIASQAVLAQGGMAILTSILGQSGSLTSQLAQLGLGLGVDSLLLKNSRTAETQADEVGTYILYQADTIPMPWCSSSRSSPGSIRSAPCNSSLTIPIPRTALRMWMRKLPNWVRRGDEDGQSGIRGGQAVLGRTRSTAPAERHAQNRRQEATPAPALREPDSLRWQNIYPRLP